MSPNVTDISNRPHITNYTITSTDSSIEINLNWSEPQLPEECPNIAFSSPPITYRVYLSSNQGPEKQLEEYYNGKVCSVTVTFKLCMHTGSLHY